MSFTPQLSQIQERADSDFLEATSNLILSMMPSVKISYWQMDTTANVIPLPIPGANTSQINSSLVDQEFIKTHQLQLQQGKFLLADRHGNCCELRAEVSLIESEYDRLFLSACYQDLYVGGICLQLASGSWQSTNQLFLQAITQHYACHYYWQKKRYPESASSLDQELQVQSLNLTHIHHEFRTPLTGILGFSKMLRDELYGTLNPKQHQYVQGILSSAEHLLALVNDFLDLSKINANCEELFWELVAVEDLCLAVISMVQSRAKERGLGLALEIGAGVDLCRLDQRRWKQILLNLLSNAIKFTETGSITLKVDRQEKYLIFSVIDTGIGIKGDDQKQLFVPFKQVSNAVNRQQKGTGLGLALSRKLAQLHGGDIRLSSEFGKGSCFEVLLPLTQPIGGEDVSGN